MRCPRDLLGTQLFLLQLPVLESTTIIVVTHDLSIAGKTDLTFTLKDGKLLNKK